MPGQNPPESPPVKRKKKAIVRANEEARSTKKTASKESPKQASGPRQVTPSSKTPDAVRGATSLNRTMEKSAMDPKIPIQVPDAVREMGEKAVEQTEKAFDAFLSAANKSVAMIPSPATDISQRTLALTEQNMKAAFEHARKLLHAKDMQEVLQIQGDFFKSQLAAAQEQMKAIGSGAVSAAKDVAQESNKS
jgi:phasin